MPGFWYLDERNWHCVLRGEVDGYDVIIEQLGTQLVVSAGSMCTTDGRSGPDGESPFCLP